jgi:hypothetical protein
MSCELEGPFRQINSGDKSAGPGKLDRVGTYSAADLQDALPLPSLEAGEQTNVWLDTVFTFLNLIEVLATTDLGRRVSDVTRSLVPETLHLLHRYR